MTGIAGRGGEGRSGRWAVAAALLCAAASVRGQAPANDECVGALPVSEGVNGTFSNVGATMAGSGPCGAVGADVWFAYTPSYTGIAGVSTCAADGGAATFDTVITIHNGSICPPLALLCCNDDGGGTCGTASKCCVTVVAGSTLYVSVGGAGGVTGTFSLAIGAGLCPCPPPAAGPPALLASLNRSWFPFDAVTAGMTADCAGGPAAAVFGAALVPGCVGPGALSFDGVDDYAEKPHVGNMNPTNTKWWNPNAGAFTIEAWIAPDAQNGLGVIVDKRTQVGTVFRGYHVYLLADGRLGCQLANGQLSGGATYTNYASTGTVPQDGCCHHVAVSVRRWALGSLGVFYIDGAPAGTFVPSDRLGSLANSSPYRVGCRSISLSGFFAGRIDDVAFYRRALTAGEIGALFAAGSSGKFMGVVPFAAPYTPAHATQPVVSADAIVTNLEPFAQTINWSLTDVSGPGETSWGGGPVASPASGSIAAAPGETVRLALAINRPAALGVGGVARFRLTCVDALGVATHSEGRIVDPGFELAVTGPDQSPTAKGSVLTANWSYAALPGAGFYATLRAEGRDGLPYEAWVAALDGRGPDYASFPLLLGLVGTPNALPGGLRTLVTAHEDDPTGAFAVVYEVGGVPVASRVVHAPIASDGPRFDIVRAAAFDPSYVPPGAAGTVEIRVDDGIPGALYVLVASPDATAFPEGPLGGVTIDPAFLSSLLSFGPPFVGFLDDGGSSSFVMPDLNLGVEFFGVVYAQDPAAPIGFAPSPPLRFVF